MTVEVTCPRTQPPAWAPEFLMDVVLHYDGKQYTAVLEDSTREYPDVVAWSASYTPTGKPTVLFRHDPDALGRGHYREAVVGRDVSWVESFDGVIEQPAPEGDGEPGVDLPEGAPRL
jgi:hypothetical protein